MQLMTPNGKKYKAAGVTTAVTVTSTKQSATLGEY
jgi:hypothetical protein